MNIYRAESNFNNININDWINFVKNHPNGNIFQTHYMYNVYNKTKNNEPTIIVIYNTNGDLIGIQLSVVLKEYDNFFGNFTKRSIVQGGPLILDDNIDILEVLLTKYLEVINIKAIYSQYRNIFNFESFKNIFIEKGFIYEDHLDILFDLTKGEEVIWNEMKRVRRKGINQAYKKGINIREIDLLDKEIFEKSYLILKSVYNRIKLPFPDISFFHNIVHNINDNLMSIGLFVNNEMIAVRIAICYKDMVYDWYAGADEDFLNYRPNDVLPWELIKLSIKNGYKIFDFGGAGKPDIPYGVRDFKLKFGGDLINFGRFEIVHKPVLMNLAKKGFKIKKKLTK